LLPAAVPDIVLGTGECGFVVKGRVRDDAVAIKTVKWKKRSDIDTLRLFMDEINVMNSIGTHDFIVRLIGSSTEHLRQGVLCLFLEYCELGSLESFLRANRDKFSDLRVDDQFFDGKKFPIVYDTEELAPAKMFSSKHLLSWSYQITKGMDYLSSKKVSRTICI
jgi:serine/threonine protein kinase